MCFGSIQAQLNDYKYIVVPKKFNDFKRENQYLTSTLVKHLFAEKGFNAIYDDALPDELNNDRCLGLTAQIKDESTMFLTKATIVLLDCQSQEVFLTQQGTSKEKEFRLSYGNAIRDAFRSFDEISYSYAPSAAEMPSEKVTVSFKDDVKQLPEVKTVENENKEEVAAKVMEEGKVAENKTIPEVVVAEVAAPEPQVKKDPEPRASDNNTVAIGGNSVTVTENAPDNNDILYAQEIPNGFQLVDSAPKVRLKIYKTSLARVYLSENEKGNGLVYEKNGQWLLEYYDGSNLKLEKLNIKF